MNIITKKINNTIIFYDNDIDINIEELFSSNALHTDERTNVEWINDKKWVKKHYFRKGMMSFLNDWYLYSGLKHTRSYREFEILNYLHGYKFNTCKPIVGWVTYSGLIYKANLVTETIQARTLKDFLDLLALGVSDSSLSNDPVIKYERPEIFKQIGIKVAQMHKLNIFHGDLNINNIMISDDPTNDGKVKIWILDFDKSLRQSLKEKDRLSNLHRLKGSLVKNKHYLRFDYETFLSSYFSTINS